MKPAKMKILLVGVLALLVLSPAAALADQITINRVNGYYSGNGGEFNVTGLNSVLSSYDQNAKVSVNGLVGFETFCLEKLETINVGQTYNYEISQAAKSGGGGAVNGSDPISIGTAFLYSQFALGTLSDYIYTSGAGRIASAGLLQNAFWWLEEEISNPGNNSFVDLVVNMFGSLDKARENSDGMFGVAVLNLTTRTGGPAQDQLVYIGVPEPATMLLLGFGLLSLAGISRRRFKS